MLLTAVVFLMPPILSNDSNTAVAGTLIQVDAFGSHVLIASGVQSAGVAFGSSGEVLAVVTADLTATVPEPASIVLFGAGLTGFSLMRVARRRNGHSYAVQEVPGKR